MKHFWLFGLIALVGCMGGRGMVMESDKSAKPGVTIEAAKRVVKGFPVILKISVSTPIAVPLSTLLDETAEIDVILQSGKTDQIFAIKSSRRSEFEITTLGGEHREFAGAERAHTRLSPGDRRTLLLDLGSLRQEIGRGTVLDDIPPGKYSVRVEFPISGYKVESFYLTLRSPSKKEKKFLESVRNLGSIKLGSGVNWSRFLREGYGMPKKHLKGIGRNARKQLAFHLMLSDILSTATTLEEAIQKPLKTPDIPLYLLSEKEWLQLEVETLSGKRVSEEKINSFLKVNPDLRWRLQELKSNGANFLLYKKLRENRQ